MSAFVRELVADRASPEDSAVIPIHGEDNELMAAGDGDIVVRPRRVIQTASVEAVRSLVATGAGLCVLPDMLFRPWSLEGDRLEMRPIVDPIPPVEVGLAWRRGSGITEAAQNFLVIAREHSRLRV